MSFDRQSIAQLTLLEVAALLASAGAEVVRATRPAGTSVWRITIAHRNGESSGLGIRLVEALIEAALQTELDGGLEFAVGIAS